MDEQEITPEIVETNKELVIDAIKQSKDNEIIQYIFDQLPTYIQEITEVQEAYTEERDRIIGEHTGEIDGMFEHRRNKEVHYKEAKQKSEEQYQREVSIFLNKKFKKAFQMSIITQYRSH
jgi:hypothetical protein